MLNLTIITPCAKIPIFTVWIHFLDAIDIAQLTMPFHSRIGVIGVGIRRLQIVVIRILIG